MHDSEYESDTAVLGGPDNPGRAVQRAWADLMQQAFAQDVLVGPRRGGDMRLAALVRQPPVAETILRHLGLWSRGPPRGRCVMAESIGPESLDLA